MLTDTPTSAASAETLTAIAMTMNKTIRFMQNSFLVIYSDFTSVANLATGFNPAAFSALAPDKTRDCP